ncbi:unnamed protein product [Ostreobium quekettii]|uniref:CBS domain-containing protein n=1 Tax=Ostreobium quekettii TaxID=121088 RepID=A0A8S1IK20_9CHLO|nr:unnamed protein product [Ostreobium quekettii]|eukprot:evm.model.scf_15EXC.3 EVM.evm.TU.scf_15EXC.3   scf_15EXC:35120-51011(+)
MANPAMRYQRLSSRDDSAAAALTLCQGSQELREAGVVEGALASLEETKDVLSRLHKMSTFESMSFDPVENDVERSAQLHRRHWDYFNEEAWRWAISALIGFLMGCIAFLVDLGIEVLNTLKISTVLQVMDVYGGVWMPYFAWVAFPVLYALVAGALVSYVEPLAAGSGIPEIKVYLNGVHIKGLLHIKALVAKLCSVMFTISAGLVAGKEGPFVHGGGIVGGGCGSMGSKFITELRGGKEFKTARKHGGYFRNHVDHRDFVAIGTAAGVSTAFAAPIGGLLFTIEEGASFYSLATVLWRGFLATSTGLITLHFLAEMYDQPGSAMWEAKLGVKRDFGLYSDGDASYGRNLYYFLWEMPIYIVIGAVGGLLGALFIKTNVKITQFRQRFIPIRFSHRRLVEVVFVAWVTSSAAFLLCYVSPCDDVPDNIEQLHLHSSSENFFGGGGVEGNPYFPQLWCPDGQYSRWGQVFGAPLTQALRLVFHLGETLPNVGSFNFKVDSLALLFLYTYLFMTWTFGIGAATGLFVPSLTVGATIGRLVGRGVTVLVQELGISKVRVSLGAYAIVGAAASLGGATRMTISIVILVMETTGALELLVPIMVATWVAKMVGDSFGLGIYDTQIELRGVPLLAEDAMEPESRIVHDELSVNELMASEMVCLPPTIKVADLAATLRKFSHGGYPVSTEVECPIRAQKGPVQIDGLITRSLLLRLLQRRIGLVPQELEGASTGRYSLPPSDKEILELQDQLDAYPMRLSAKADQEKILSAVPAEVMERVLDLRPFMQRQPFFVNSTASLTRAYRLFRTMGLRHLLVAPTKPLGMGILTRKDIIKENAKVALGEKANRIVSGKSRMKKKFTRTSTRRLVEFMPGIDTAAETGTALSFAPHSLMRQITRRRGSLVRHATIVEDNVAGVEDDGEVV